jgi:cytosolic carboxypeptidase protein 5
MYESLGKSMLVSLLDLFDLNPYSRIPNTPYKSIEALRKDLATQLSKADRFRKAEGLNSRVKAVNDLAH